MMSWKTEENISNCIATIVWHKKFSNQHEAIFDFE